MIKKFAFPLIQGGKTKEFSLVKSEVTKKSKTIFQLLLDRGLNA